MSSQNVAEWRKETEKKKSLPQKVLKMTPLSNVGMNQRPVLPNINTIPQEGRFPFGSRCGYGDR